MIIVYDLLIYLLGILLSYLVVHLCDYLPTADEVADKKAWLFPHCSQCREKRKWIDFLTLHSCRNCNRKAPLRHWITVGFFPFIFAFLYFYPADKLDGGWMGVLVFYFAIVAIIDISHRIILRSLTFIGWLLTFIAGFLMHGLVITLLGGAAGLLAMLILFYAGVLFKKFMEKRRGEAVEDALGFGDVYIAVMAGFILGFPNVFSGIVLAILLGGLTSLAYLIGMLLKKDYKPFTPIPYAPFIILGMFLLMYR